MGLVEVFPNPTTGEFNVQLSNFGNGEVIFTIYDLKGQIVINETTVVANSKTLGFDLSDLPSGSYLLKVQQGDNFATERINLIR